MPLRFRHEVVGPSIHRFVFPSESRPGVEHELLLDLSETGPGRLSCLCEASLYGRLCKHKRFVILGGRRVRPTPRARGKALTPSFSTVRRKPRRQEASRRRTKG